MVKVYRNICFIFDGSKVIKFNFEFFYCNNYIDIIILNKVWDSLEGCNFIFYMVVIFCNVFMNVGIINDKFFCDNLDWFGKVINWFKFIVMVVFGVIYCGNIIQFCKLLEFYFFKQIGVSSGGFIFSQGGVFYVYGFIYVNYGVDVFEYLCGQFNGVEEEVIQYGGVLGFGIVGMVMGDEQIFEDFIKVFFVDFVFNGEVVGLVMGLIMLGIGNVKVVEIMFIYVYEIIYEKIVCGFVLGMVFIMFG